MKNTTEYFQKTAEELLTVKDNSYTKEDCLLFDEGLLVHFCDDEEEFKDFLSNQSVCMPKLDFKVALKTVKGKIAVILN